VDLFEYAEKSSESIAPEPAIFTVSEITHEVKSLILQRFGRDPFWVKGELSNYRGPNHSGHMYFRLKDAGAVLNCVFFRNANRKLNVEIKDGLEILAFGRLDLWEPGGNYQLIIEELRPGGAGELYLRFEQRKKKLESEGLFASERKRPLPEFPQRVGVITSPTGAVIRDIIHVIRNRCPFIKVLLYSVKVQGEGAAAEIARAIEEMNRPEHKLEVLIVGRGGGSIEDLWAFNEELVARAIAGSRLPVISAVGHQTDFTIADFVSDQRAATPSQAAELAVPNVSELHRRVELVIRNIVRELVRVRDLATQRLTALARSTALRDPRMVLRDRTQRVDLAVERLIDRLTRRRDRDAERVASASESLRVRLSRYLRPHQLQFERVASNLGLLNPLAILERGYSVVKTGAGGIVKLAKQVRQGDEVEVKLYEGGLACQVTKIFER
jgi:exodeoxyribonuclease VII large subunit